MIYIAGMSIAILFELLLIGKKNKSQSDMILLCWMFLITIHLFWIYMFLTGEVYNYPFLLGINFPLPLLHGVFLYLYVGSVTNQLPSSRKLLAIHFIPAIVVSLYLIKFFVLPAEQKILVYKNHGAGYEAFITITQFGVILSGIVYVLWSSLLLRKHRSRILDTFSYQDKIDLRWLQILTLGMGAIWLLVFYGDNSLIFTGVAVFVFLIGFFGIRQARIFDIKKVSFPDSEKKSPEKEVEKEKYAKSGLTEELSEKLYESLTALMTKETLYRNNELSIDDLASRLSVHPNYLSQVINEREKKNFYDFVNQYRLDEFKKLIANPKNRHLTLLALAYECGFNSKSSFNRYFKKVTSQTPSEYFAAINKS